MKGKKKVRAYKKRDYQAFIYLAPWLIGLIVLQMYPFKFSVLFLYQDYRLHPNQYGQAIERTTSPCLPETKNLSLHSG